jgi:protein AroM
MSRKIGIVTIGQAPRTDVQPIFQKYLPDVEVVQAGVLDGLQKNQIDQTLSPVDGDYVLTTRLQTGDSVLVARHKIESLLQQKVHQLEDAQCDPILVLCTGVFESLITKKSVLLEPDHVIPPVVAVLIKNRKLGVIAPLEEQIDDLEEKWTNVGLYPYMAAASPYTGDHSEFERAVQKLKAQGAEVLLMDCMGYDEQMKADVMEISGLPVILSNALMVKLMSELV